jgi:RNA polymerase sigma-70 factor (ECF subfamily)
MMDEDKRDQDIVERIQAGDKSACAECIDLHADNVYGLALRMMGNEADAEDIVQETFINAFEAIDQFEGRSKLSTWLYRIAYNNALMHLRRKEPRTVSVDAPLEMDDGALIPRQLFDWCCLPEEDLETEEARAKLESAIRALPETLKPAFVLRELEGLSTRETAEVLDVSEGAVKTRLHRARLWLRERLSDYFAEYATVKLEG